MATAFDVIGRQAGQVFTGVIEMAGALDLGPGAELAGSSLLTEAGWTLFSFDMARSEAVFLDIGPDMDLSLAPFSYQRQYDCARRLVRLPFAELIDLARQIPAGRPQAHLFNIGHCGSTLLHNAFNRSGAAWCLSEPMFVFDLAMARATVPAPERVALLRAGFAFMRLLPGLGAGQVQVIKHLSQAMTICGDCHRATPQALCLFLYREAESWCNSIYGFAQRMVGLPIVMAPSDRDFIWWIMSGNTPPAQLGGLVDLTAEVVTFDAMAAAAWVLNRRFYAEALAQGVPMQATRYDALVQDRAGTLARIFGHCGLGMVDMAAVMQAYDTDSHGGTASARSLPVRHFSQSERARVHAFLAGLPEPMTGRELWPDAADRHA